MKDNISIFNYEAFYLDYLEGNLDEKDTLMLLSFLESHPDCIIDSDDFPSLKVEDIKHPNNVELKMIADEEIITLHNVEHFIIASTEGVLNQIKTRELASFLKIHPDKLELAEAYQRIKFSPDLNLKFENKLDLKQDVRIQTWPYWSAAAVAAVLIAIFTLLPEDVNQVTAAHSVNAKVENNTDKNPTTNNTFISEDTEDPKESVNQFANEEIIRVPEKGPSLNPVLADLNSRASIHPKSVRNILNNSFNLAPEPVAFISYAPTIHQEENSDLAYVSSDLVNPIEPITNFISNKTNVDVDFKQRKKTSQKNGGFYLKIGKFQLSRNEH